MSDYTPNNVPTFVSAYAGTYAGMAIAGRGTYEGTASDDAGLLLLSQVALAFAEEVDTLLGLEVQSGGYPGLYSTLGSAFILEACSGYWANRSMAKGSGPLSVDPADYELEAESLVLALVQAYLTYVDAVGSDPPFSSAWTNVYEVDYTSLPNQTMSDSGPNIIPNNVVPDSGSTSWTYALTGTGTLEIVEGQGLEFASTTAETGLSFFAGLQDLIPQSLDWSLSARLWVYIPSNTSDDGSTLQLSINDLDNPGNGYGMELEGSTCSANVVSTAVVTDEGTPYVFTNTVTFAHAPTAYDTLVVEIPALSGAEIRTYLAHTEGVFNGATLFPVQNIVGNLSTANASFQWPDPTDIVDPTVGGPPIALSSLIAVIGGICNTTLALTIGRLRIEIR